MDWLELFIGIVVVLAFLVFGIAGAVMVMVSRLVRQGIKLTPASEQEYPRDFAALREIDEWARAQGFEFVGSYIADLLSPSFVAAWRHRERPTYLCMYGVQHVYVYEFVTQFAGDWILTTASTPDSQLLPRPHGCYLQSFTGLSLDQLLDRHASAELFLIKEGRLEAAPPGQPFEEALSTALMRQLAYVRTIRLWWLRGGYWFLVRKNRLHGMTVQESHRARKAPLPHEARFKGFPNKAKP